MSAKDDGLAAILGAAGRIRYLRHGESVAVYIGTQRSGRRGFRNIPLYNLKRPIGNRPAGQTVSDRTLIKLGYTPPAAVLMGGER